MAANSRSVKSPEFAATFYRIVNANRAVHGQLRSGLSTQQTRLNILKRQERGKVQVIGNDENIGHWGKIIVQRSGVKERELSADVLQSEHRADEVDDGLCQIIIVVRVADAALMVATAVYMPENYRAWTGKTAVCEQTGMESLCMCLFQSQLDLRVVRRAGSGSGIACDRMDSPQ